MSIAGWERNRCRAIACASSMKFPETKSFSAAASARSSFDPRAPVRGRSRPRRRSLPARRHPRLENSRGSDRDRANRSRGETTSSSKLLAVVRTSSVAGPGICSNRAYSSTAESTCGQKCGTTVNTINSALYLLARSAAKSTALSEDAEPSTPTRMRSIVLLPQPSVPKGALISGCASKKIDPAQCGGRVWVNKWPLPANRREKAHGRQSAAGPHPHDHDRTGWA